MKKLSLAALFGISLICLSISPAILAEEPDSLDNIVVTADRKARTVDETLAPVSIITRKDIEKYQATSIPEVLRRVPGINITNDGGMGKNTSVFLRGTNSDHLLVLVDGVKIGSATLGSIAFEDIPLEQVERIEVVRGPRSSLYGSEAIGGVIQIFTRKGGKGFHPEISVSAGSHNTQQGNVNLAGGDKTTWYNLNAGSEKTDGIKIQPNDLTPKGYRRESASLRSGHRFADGTEAEVSVLHAQGDNHFDGDTFSGNQSDFTQQALSGKLKHPLGERVMLSAQVGQSLDKSYLYFNGGNFSPFASRQFDTQRDTASLQADIQTSPNGSLTVGADHQRDKVTSDNAYAVAARKNSGAFASYQHRMGNNNVEVSARQDDNQQFGTHNTGALAIGHNFTNGVRVTASQGTAFKAPTFNDLYWPGAGNATLKPEQSNNTELGISGHLAAGSWSANVFENKVDDLIAWKDVGGGVWLPSNVNQARIQGIEASAKTRLAGWDIGGNLTLQKPQNRSGADAGKLLIFRPKQIASVDVDRRFGKFRAGATLHGESQRYTDAANTESAKLPGYGTLDLRADYKLSKDWTVGTKIGNVLNKQYQTNNGYNQDGINGLVTVKYAPK